jgi:hypothetical protein
MGNLMKATAKVKEFKPMTPEERQEAAARAYAQKRESIATGVLFNLMHNEDALRNNNAEELATLAIEVADKMIEKLYFTHND